MQVTGGQGVQAALFERETVGEAAYGPARAGSQPVSRHTQGQREMRTPLGDLGERGRVGVRALLSDQGGQEGGGFRGGELAEGQAVNALQAGEHPSAGDHHHSRAGARQERADLCFVAGVVQHQQAAPFRQCLPVQLGVALRAGLGQVLVRHPQRLQDTEYQLGRAGRGVVHAAQVDHELRVGKAVGQHSGGVQCQGGLARPRRPGQHHDHRLSGGLSGQCRQPCQLRLPADEIVDAARERTHAGRGVTGFAAGPGGGQQTLPLHFAESQAGRQRGDRSPLWSRPPPPLEISDPADADPRRLRQRLDRQRRLRPQLTQQCAESLTTHVGHPAPPAPSRHPHPNRSCPNKASRSAAARKILRC